MALDALRRLVLAMAHFVSRRCCRQRFIVELQLYHAADELQLTPFTRPPRELVRYRPHRRQFLLHDVAKRRLVASPPVRQFYSSLLISLIIIYRSPSGALAAAAPALMPALVTLSLRHCLHDRHQRFNYLGLSTYLEFRDIVSCDRDFAADDVMPRRDDDDTVARHG